jgi:hypothetical protein
VAREAKVADLQEGRLLPVHQRVVQLQVPDLATQLQVPDTATVASCNNRELQQLGVSQ